MANHSTRLYSLLRPILTLFQKQVVVHDYSGDYTLPGFQIQTTLVACQEASTLRPRQRPAVCSARVAADSPFHSQFLRKGPQWLHQQPDLEGFP